jgi:hypothetical protein
VAIGVYCNSSTGLPGVIGKWYGRCQESLMTIHHSIELSCATKYYSFDFLIHWTRSKLFLSQEYFKNRQR